MKKILGLDLGTNSIGWALVDKEANTILGMGSRIIPMGTDKQDYEKGVGITKNADRREKRTARKMNKRYKLRRNKLLFVLHILDMLPEQFQFKDGLPEPTKIQNLELLPIKKGTLQLDSLAFQKMKVDALFSPIDLKDFGKVLYNFNQLRGYSGGNNDDDKMKKVDDQNEDETKKKYEVIVQKVKIISVEQSDDTFTLRGGKNKGEKLFYYNVTFILDDEEKEGKTELQNLQEKIGEEEELEIRLKRNKNGEETSITITLPQKSNWRKAMEADEKSLKENNLFISELRLQDLQQKSKWTKIRNRVFLRNRYMEEFDKVWETQAKKHEILNNCPKEKIEKIVNYIFPGTSDSQQELREKAIKNGLHYIIKEQIIYYQRPLKPQTELISNCSFEKNEKVIATSHPLFQEFRCWKQINNLYITSKVESKNAKYKYQYQNRYLTIEEKQKLYEKLQTQKEVGFGTVIEILNINNPNGEKLDKEQKDYFLNGLNIKAKLKGCDTLLSFKKHMGKYFDEFIKKDTKFIEKLWEVIFDVTNHDGSEYDIHSKRVSSIIEFLKNYSDNVTATNLALKLAQNIKFPRKYASISAKMIQKILPLMLPNPQNILEEVKTKFENIKHLIDTGEILDNVDYKLEDYVIEFIKNNPDILQNGGLMEAFAISLVYGKHTTETIKAQISNYHDIKSEERNLRNPIVEQLANETMQVIKAIWKQYKFNPNELEIRVELARDLKNSAQEREKIYKGQLNSKKVNDNIKKRLSELKQETSSKNIDLYKLWSKQNTQEYPKQSKEATLEEIQKLRLWEEQGCISPYTGKPIPLSKLFSPDRLYDIDHIIPKSRYFDDSSTNKVVCETNVNEEKGNRTAWEYISQQNSHFEILNIDNYLSNTNKMFFGKKKKNLLAEKIPSNPVERQLKDTQYISIAVKNELAKVVGSENVKTSTGEVTDFLRSRWGLKKLFMELTESRFKQMELWDLDENGSPNTNWITKCYDKEKQKHIYEIKHWSKRYDHRHHSIDALVVALTEQAHIKRLNDLNKYIQEELIKRKEVFKIEQKEDETILDAFFNLEAIRRDEILRNMESSRKFEIPFPNLVEQVKAQLESMIVSHKPKDKLCIKVDDQTKKEQLKIRGALHQETYYGKLDGRDTKRVELSTLSVADIPKIVIDKSLANEIIEHKKEFSSIKEAFTGEGLKIFNEKRKVNGKQPVFKVKVWYNKEVKKESTLQRLYDNNEKQSVITGDNYLFIVMEKESNKGKERVFDIASLYDSVDIAKSALKENDTNFKKRIVEYFRIKHKEKPNKVLFTLQQNELVYLPNDLDDSVLSMSNIEFCEWIKDNENKKRFCERVYKVVMFTGSDCKFIPHNYSNVISIPKELTEEQKEQLKKKHEEKKSIPKNELNFVEFGSYRDCSPYETGEVFIKSLTNKKQKQKPLKIQDSCIKIKTDWLGNISLT